MRVRTAIAGTTLAFLTLLWTAPVAPAADGGHGGSSESTATPTPTPPAQRGGSGGHDGGNGSAGRGDSAGSAGSDNGGHGAQGSQPTATPPTTTQPVPTSEPAPTPANTIHPIPAEPRAQLSVSPGQVRPGDQLTANASCSAGEPTLSGDDVSFAGTTGTVAGNASPGSHTVTLVCDNAGKRATATAQFQVQPGRQGPLPGGPGPVNPGGPNRPGPGDPDNGQVKATLSVSPKVVRQGDAVYANGDCHNSTQQGLFGDGVSFNGDRGWVDDNASLGDHTVTRVCVNGPKRDVATDRFRVILGGGSGQGPGGGNGPWDLWLSERSGYRGDEVDVSVRCRDDRAQLDSDVLDDITLRRHGSRLTGITHVRDHADDGWNRVTVSCDGNSQSVGFWVLRDRGDHNEYLDLDPAFGHRGDAVDVHVGCDSWVSSLHSNVLDDIDLDHDGRPWRFEGTTHVRDDADPGEHTVRVRCGGDALEVSFFVQGSGDRDGDDGGSQGGGNDVTVYPKGAPETGGGPTGQSSAGLFALGLTGLTGAGLSGRNRRKDQR
jgi:hypothetical protein